MNHFALSALITSVTVFGLGAFVYMKRRDRVSLLFFLYSLSISVWSLAVYQHGPHLDDVSAMVWGRVLHVAAIMIPVFFYHFVVQFMDISKKRKHIIYLAYALAGCFQLTLATPYLINGTSYQDQYSYPIPGSLLYLVWFSFFVFMIILSLYELHGRIDRTDGKVQTQIKYLFYSSLIGYVGGMDNFLITANIEIFPLYPYGLYAVAFYVLVMAYAMIRHKLFDIDVIIKKVTIFAGLFGAMYAIFAIFTFMTQKIFSESLGWNIWQSVIPTFVVIAFIGRPLEDWLKNITQKFLFQKSYDESSLLAHFVREVLTIVDSITLLVKKTVKGLDDIIHLESIGVVLKEDSSSKYKLVESRGISNAALQFDENSAVIKKMIETKSGIQRPVGHRVSQDNPKLAEEFQLLKCELCLPLLFENNLFGFIALGAKKSGKNYTEKDVSLLTDIAQAESIAIFNIKKVKEAKKAEAESAQNERMLEIGGLTSGINHEIASPLTVMLGNSHMFLKGLQGKDITKLPQNEMIRTISQAQDILKSVQKQSEFISGITTDLSDYAKNKEIHMTEVNAAEEVKDSLELIKDMLDDVTVEINIPKDTRNMYAGRQSIRQVITNILKNAVQAMDYKGKVQIEAREEGDYVVISIKDSGPGIPEDIQKEIFKPFFTTKRGRGGTGLGLYLTHLLVRRNKGELAMQSKVGEGTTFYILLQAYVGQQIQQEGADTPKEYTRIKKSSKSPKQIKPSILTVDDQPDLVDMIQTYFESKGYEVDKALDGFKAVEFVKKKDYGVILLDYQMPGKEGDQVLKEIKELKPRQKVLMVSSMTGDESIRKRLYELGAEYCINKPIKFEELEERVSRLATPVETPAAVEKPVEGSTEKFMSQESENGHYRKLLVADDDEGIRSMIRMFFEARGFEVYEASNPDEVVTRASSYKPDVILLDLKMNVPEDGLKAIPGIRKASPSSIILITTGNDDAEIMSRAKGLGAADYVMKPLKLEDLLSIVRTHSNMKEETHNDG